MPMQVTEGGKLTRSVNFFKKQSNWNKILRRAMENVAGDIRNDAEIRLYQRWKKTTGKTGKSIQPRIYRRGNITYISLVSNHPAMNFLEYGGELKDGKFPTYSPLLSGRLWEYVREKPGWNTETLAARMSSAIYENQPFKRGTFHMKLALRAGLPKLEGEVIRTANRMRPK
tara:strand:- start:367 stop:879 length:513 start_codon:yes stop_codon:yes gene_type:complete